MLRLIRPENPKNAVIGLHLAGTEIRSSVSKNEGTRFRATLRERQRIRAQHSANFASRPDSHGTAYELGRAVKVELNDAWQNNTAFNQDFSNRNGKLESAR